MKQELDVWAYVLRCYFQVLEEGNISTKKVEVLDSAADENYFVEHPAPLAFVRLSQRTRNRW